MKSILFVVIYLLIGFSSFAQESLESTFRNFVKAIDGIEQKKNFNDIKQYLSSDYKSSVTFISLDKSLKTVEGDLQTLHNTLIYLINNKDFTIEMNVVEIEKVKEEGDLGLVNATVDYKLYYKKELAEEQSFEVLMLANRQPDQKWVFTQLKNRRSVLLQNIGTCLITIYESDNRYISETIFPGGLASRKQMNYFDFVTNEDFRSISVDGYNYIWQDNGSIINEDKKIATANNSDEAIKALLVEIYAKSCSRIIYR